MAVIAFNLRSPKSCPRGIDIKKGLLLLLNLIDQAEKRSSAGKVLLACRQSWPVNKLILINGKYFFTIIPMQNASVKVLDMSLGFNNGQLHKLMNIY